MRIFLISGIMLFASCDNNPDRIHPETVCVQLDRAGRAACFDHCVEYSRAGASEEGEDTLYACEGVCDRLHCRKHARRCVDSAARQRKCLPGMH